MTYTHWAMHPEDFLPMPVLEALEAHLNGRDDGYVFQGRDSGHISTRQIQRLLDEAAEKPDFMRYERAKLGSERVRGRKHIYNNTVR